jgi:hypothetical protein
MSALVVCFAVIAVLAIVVMAVAVYRSVVLLGNYDVSITPMNAQKVQKFTIEGMVCPKPPLWGKGRLVVDSAQYSEPTPQGPIVVTDITKVAQTAFDKAPGAAFTEKDLNRPSGGDLALRLHCAKPPMFW